MVKTARWAVGDQNRTTEGGGAESGKQVKVAQRWRHPFPLVFCAGHRRPLTAMSGGWDPPSALAMLLNRPLQQHLVNGASFYAPPHYTDVVNIGVGSFLGGWAGGHAVGAHAGAAIRDGLAGYCLLGRGRPS